MYISNVTTPVLFSVKYYFNHDKTHITSSVWNVNGVDAVYIWWVLADKLHSNRSVYMHFHTPNYTKNLNLVF